MSNSPDKIEQILVAIGRLEEKVDAFKETQDRQNLRLDNHGSRISSLEQSRSWAQGALFGVPALVSAVVAGAITWLRVQIQ